MIAIYDPSKKLRNFVSKKIQNKEVYELDSINNLKNALHNNLDEFSQILINTSDISDSEQSDIMQFIDTPKKQVKILLYQLKNNLPILLNATIFGMNGLEKDNQDANKNTSKVEHKPIKNPFASKFEHIFIGVSTGGPSTLELVIPQFPKDIKASIVVVQHMLKGKHIYNLCDRLDKISQITVKVAEDGEILRDGIAYFPPPGTHAYYKKHSNNDVSIHLTDKYPKNDNTALFEADHKFVHVPSVDISLESAADVYGDKMVATILTGMGSDGAIALKYARDLGAHTLSESQETCVVYGMPKAAVEKGGSMQVLKHYLIPNRILEIINHKSKPNK